MSGVTNLRDLGSKAEPRSFIDTFEEGLRFFMSEGELNKTVARLGRDLESHGIEYAIIGAVALNAHGYLRFTADVDLILTREGLEVFHQKLVGLGYRPAFEGARKKLRSTLNNVAVEIITEGEFPGDGKPKPVSFPRPSAASVDIDGVRVVTLEKLIELKLASGMTAPDRLKDLADVQELIKVKHLAKDFADKLNPYVRGKYLELWNAVQSGSSNTFEEQS